MVFKDVISVLGFDKRAISSVSKRGFRDAYLVLLGVACLIVLFAFLFPAAYELEAIASLGIVARVFAFFFGVGLMFVFLSGYVWLSAFIVRFVARLLGGSGSTKKLFRVFSFISVLYVLSNIPVDAFLVQLLLVVWVVSLEVFVISVIEQVSVARAAAIFLLYMLCFAVIFFFLLLVFVLPLVLVGVLA